MNWATDTYRQVWLYRLATFIFSNVMESKTEDADQQETRRWESCCFAIDAEACRYFTQVTFGAVHVALFDDPTDKRGR
jgi:hypothetical protein